jgi:acyl carrier protein
MTQYDEVILPRLQRLAAEVLELDLPDHELIRLARLDEMMGLDSIAVALFVVAVEREFGIALGGEDLERETIANLPVLAERIAHHLAPPC